MKHNCDEAVDIHYVNTHTRKVAYILYQVGILESYRRQ